MASESDLYEALPQLSEIGDGELENRVVEVYLDALDRTNHGSIQQVPWSPRLESYVGTQRFVDHVSEVADISIALVDVIDDVFSFEVDRDVVVAGALVHDISKIVDFRGMDEYSESDVDPETDIGRLLQHPHFGVYLLEAVGLSTHLQHIVLSHSTKTPVDPATIEAQIVASADELAANGRFWAETGELMPPHAMPWEKL